jgi:hypothetical protein
MKCSQHRFDVVLTEMCGAGSLILALKQNEEFKYVRFTPGRVLVRLRM